jgi:hypothetical protein
MNRRTVRRLALARVVALALSTPADAQRGRRFGVRRVLAQDEKPLH